MQVEKLDGAMSGIRAEAATADKRAEYSLSLYNKITNITWDYENTSPNAVSGCKFIEIVLIYNYHSATCA